jgi:glycosyltransferase involved in cell wall biosynthesis
LNTDHSLVSIITPSYNSSKYIEETIVSVLNQTYPYWEMIIIDDGSHDDTKEIIASYARQDERIKILFNNSNIGAAKSRNRGIENANGDYIAFLDSDDLWLPNKLQQQVTLMETKNVLMSYSAYDTIDEHAHTLSTFPVQERVTYHDMLKTSSIGTLTTIYNAKKLGKIYFENIGHEDYVMKLKILKEIPFAYGVKEPLAKYRIHAKGLSRNKLNAALWQWHIYREVEELSIPESIYYFTHYAFHGFFKYR